MENPVPPGFYGKIPTLGDFVSRRLPRQFIDAWDGWLESAFAASREQLGAQWLDLYLTSPIWRFGATAGLLGDTAWVGILMPSVDKVGRYFPLTLAVPLADGGILPMLFNGAGAWFETIEQLALSALGDDFDLDRFDLALQQASPPELGWTQVRLRSAQGEAETGRFVIRVSMESPAELPSAFAGISAGLLDRFVPAHSLWSTEGSESVSPSVLICEGLPPIDAYAAFLAGHWSQRGWSPRAWVRTAPRDPPQAPSPEPAGATETAPISTPVADPPCHWLSHGISETGLRRKINEDAFLERPAIGLWAVADGMGGHQAGEVASAAVIDALATVAAADHLDDTISRVNEALGKANTRLRELASGMGAEQIIGSTVVALLVSGNRGAVLWAGDSRLYRYRNGSLEQLSRDHSLLDEVSRLGWPAGGEPPQNLPFQNIITRAVGADAELIVDRLDIDIAKGDRFLLCSDGLDKEVEPGLIATILGQGDEKSSAGALIDAALAHGARDNVTVVVVHHADLS